jgi:hypothetical protein
MPNAPRARVAPSPTRLSFDYYPAFALAISFTHHVVARGSHGYRWSPSLRRGCVLARRPLRTCERPFFELAPFFGILAGSPPFSNSLLTPSFRFQLTRPLITSRVQSTRAPTHLANVGCGAMVTLRSALLVVLVATVHGDDDNVHGDGRNEVRLPIACLQTISCPLRHISHRLYPQ